MSPRGGSGRVRGQRRTGLTGSGWAVLAGGGVLLASGMALGYPTLTGLGAAAGAALALGAGFTLFRPRVTVQRVVSPDRVTVGESAGITLVVGNPGRFPAPGFDAVEQVGGSPLRVRVPALGPRTRRTVHLTVTHPRRGLIRLGPVIVERQDPLGLIRHASPLSDRAWLWVRPRVHPARALPLGVMLDFEGRTSEQALAGSTAFSSLREYVPGDDPRHIHWRSSARVGNLLVREHVDTTEPTTAIVLDTRTGVLDRTGFEQAVEVAAAVAAASRRVGQQVTFAADGEDLTTVRRAGGYEVMDRLAAVTRTDPGDPTAPVRLAERARPGGSLVVISGDDPRLAARLGPARRRFARVVVVLLGTAAGATAGGTIAAGNAAAGATRRPGLTVIQAGSAREAVQTWSRLLAGVPA